MYILDYVHAGGISVRLGVQDGPFRLDTLVDRHNGAKDLLQETGALLNYLCASRSIFRIARGVIVALQCLQESLL